MRLYEFAARRGDADSLHNLGMIYLEGKGTEQDCEAAIEFLKMAAERGCVPAMRKLGFIFYDGTLTELDLETSWLWFDLSRTAGDKDGREHCFMVSAKSSKLGIEMDDGSLFKRSIEMREKIFNS